jgi:type IV secretion system protein VirB10
MGRWHVALAIVGATTLALGFVGYRAATHHPKEPQRQTLSVQPTVHYEPAPPPVQQVIFRPPPMTPLPPASPVAPPPAPATMPQPPRPEQDPARQARHASLLAYGSVGNPGGPPAAQPGGGGPTGLSGAPGAPRQTELAAKLVPTQVTAVTATVLQHQPYLLTRGTQIQCVLLTAIDSTLPGPISCRLPYDVIGKTGLTLLDRGSIIVGETGGTMQQGQNRLFALWTRAETPNGVVINLDSPGADPLGRSGFEGDVDSHWGARIGGALLLSVVQGALQVATSAVSPNGSTSLNLGGTEGAVAEALRGSVNIRPTLRMNQGDNISVSVIRDLDFSSVYAMAVR